MESKEVILPMFQLAERSSPRLAKATSRTLLNTEQQEWLDSPLSVPPELGLQEEAKFPTSLWSLRSSPATYDRQHVYISSVPNISC